jgi:hypothetical protein
MGRYGLDSCFCVSIDGTRLCLLVFEPSDIARMRASLMETVRLGNQSGRFEKAQDRKSGDLPDADRPSRGRETERSSSILLHPNRFPPSILCSLLIADHSQSTFPLGRNRAVLAPECFTSKSDPGAIRDNGNNDDHSSSPIIKAQIIRTIALDFTASHRSHTSIHPIFSLALFTLSNIDLKSDVISFKPPFHDGFFPRRYRYNWHRDLPPKAHMRYRCQSRARDAFRTNSSDQPTLRSCRV